MGGSHQHAHGPVTLIGLRKLGSHEHARSQENEGENHNDSLMQSLHQSRLKSHSQENGKVQTSHYRQCEADGLVRTDCFSDR